MRISTVFVILAAIYLGACQPPGRSGGSTPSPVSLKAQDAHVSCQVDRPCPDSIALVRAVVNGQMQSCTGALVSEDTIMTAASCLPQTCQENLAVMFPATSTSVQTTRKCGAIRIEGSVGFVTFERGVARPALAFERAPMLEKQTFFVYSVKAEKSNTYSIQTSQCQYNQGAVSQSLLKQSVNASPLYLAPESCTNQNLSLGSLLVNPESRILGIVQNHEKDLETGRSYAVVAPSACVGLPGEPSQSTCVQPPAQPAPATVLPSAPSSSSAPSAAALPARPSAEALGPGASTSLPLPVSTPNDIAFKEATAKWRLSLPTQFIYRLKEIRTGVRLDLSAVVKCRKPNHDAEKILKASLPSKSYVFKAGSLVVLSEAHQEVTFDLSKVDSSGQPPLRECTSTELSEDAFLQTKTRAFLNEQASQWSSIDQMR